MDDLFNFDNSSPLFNAGAGKSPQAGIGALRSQPPLPRSKSAASDTSQSEAHEQKQKEKKEVIRIAICGDPQVGKTSFVKKHLNGEFDASYRATVGCSTFHLEFNTNLDTHKFEVLDIAGQSLFAGKKDDYYKDIKGAMIMYDVMNWGSYDNITQVWLPELREKAPAGIPIVVVANKMENRDIRAVSVEVVAEAISNEFEPKGIGYCEVSVKTNQNLAEPFLFLTKRLLNIKDNKALYFVSKISELNLIESMLAHKKTRDEQKLSKPSPAVSSQSAPQNLDNIWSNTTKKQSNENNNNAKAYLDDVLFNLDSKAENTQSQAAKPSNAKNRNESETKSQSMNDNFLADMMAQSSKTAKKPEATPSKLTKAASTSPKARPAVTVSSGHVMNHKQGTVPVSKPRSQSQSQRQHANTSSTSSSSTVSSSSRVSKHVSNDNGNSDVMIELLLGIQETLNGLTRDVRRLQNDVAFLKQESQRGRTQRK